MPHNHMIYDTDRRFNIDITTRAVVTSDKRKPSLIQYDHNSEVISFKMDRFVEGHDLSKCDKVEVHYVNIGSGGINRNSGVYSVEDLQIDPDDNTKMMFSWLVSENATMNVGYIKFVISFACTEEGELQYRWNTGVNDSISVLPGINNGEYVAQTYADVLETWRTDLFGTGDTVEASIKLMGEEVVAVTEQALAVKAKNVMDSIPNEYMDYSAFEQSKANVGDINRLFDSDFIQSSLTNCFPYDDSEFEYDGTKTYTGHTIGSTFALEKGRYKLVVPDTNAVGIYVMLASNDSVRLFQATTAKNPSVTGVHTFEVTEEYHNKSLKINYYAALNTVMPAGTCYCKRVYIFKVPDTGLLDDDLFTKAPARLLNSDIVKRYHGENLYTGGDVVFSYDGVNTYIGKNSCTFTLEEGDYVIYVLDTNGLELFINPSPTESDSIRLVKLGDAAEPVQFTITSEYANIPLELFVSASLDAPTEARVCYARSVYIFKDEGKPFFPEYMLTTANKPGYLNANAATMNTGEYLRILDVCHVRMNTTTVFTGKFNSFGELRVGMGETQYGAAYIDINSTTITVKAYTTEVTTQKTLTHGLTMSSVITVIIKAGFNTANITVITANGSFTAQDVPWIGSNGLFFAKSISGSYTDCEITTSFSDINKDIWVFGDSYLGTNDRRWVGQMYNLGYTNFLACGFPGGKSSNEYESMKTLLTIGKPKIIAWCLGMNDGDSSSAINDNWLTYVTKVISLCRKHGVELVLATIPSCPIAPHTFKNEYVRNSGYRYIDFNKAMGVNGTTWYTGMLSGDNVHPTELGAKALASRVCIDLPEIMQ